MGPHTFVCTSSRIFCFLWSVCVGNYSLCCLPSAHPSHVVCSFLIFGRPSTIYFFWSNIKSLWLRWAYLWCHNSSYDIVVDANAWWFFLVTSRLYNCTTLTRVATTLLQSCMSYHLKDFELTNSNFKYWYEMVEIEKNRLYSWNIYHILNLFLVNIR